MKFLAAGATATAITSLLVASGVVSSPAALVGGIVAAILVLVAGLIEVLDAMGGHDGVFFAKTWIGLAWAWYQ